VEDVELDQTMELNESKVVVTGVLDAVAASLPGTVVIVNDIMPSWLTLLGSRVSLIDTHHWTRNEATSVRRSLDLPKCNFEYSSEDLFLNGHWRQVSSHRTFLMSGGSRFCHHVLSKLESLNALRDDDSILIVSSGRNKVSLPFRNFRWTNAHHHLLGGVTCGRYNVGMSSDLHLDGDAGLPLSMVRRCFSKLVQIAEKGKACPKPGDEPIRVEKEPFDCRLAPKPAQLAKSFLVPSVFSHKSGWVTRCLTTKEQLLALDIPVGAVAALELSCQMKPAIKPALLELPPAKVLQAVIPLLVPSGSDVEMHSKLGTTEPSTVPKLSLTTFAPAVAKAEVTEANSKAVKSDDAVTNEAFWNEGAVTPPNGIIPVGWIMVNGLYDDATHGKIFRFIRGRMARIFARNVTKSLRNYLRTSYSSVELDSGSSEAPEGPCLWCGSTG
jgi:hypothetical protein